MPPPGCVLPRCPPPRRRTAPSRRGIKRTASSTSSPRYWFGRAYRPKQLAVGGQLLHVHCVLDRHCGARCRDYRQRVVADSGLVAEAGPARGDRGRAPSRRRRRLTARTEQIHETGQGCRIGGGWSKLIVRQWEWPWLWQHHRSHRPLHLHTRIETGESPN